MIPGSRVPRSGNAFSGATKVALQERLEPEVVRNQARMRLAATDVNDSICHIVELGGKQIGETRVVGGVMTPDPGSEGLRNRTIRSSEKGSRTPL